MPEQLRELGGGRGGVAERGGLVEGEPDLGGGAQLDRLVAGGHSAASQVRVLGDVGREFGDELGELRATRARRTERAQAPDLAPAPLLPASEGGLDVLDPIAGDVALEPVDGLGAGARRAAEEGEQIGDAGLARCQRQEAQQRRAGRRLLQRDAGLRSGRHAE